MNIDELTIGQLKEIMAFAVPLTETKKEEEKDLFVGKHVICRCYSAGVHAGVLVSHHGEEVILKDSRRLWSWKSRDGIALSGVAQHGIDRSKSKLDSINPLIKLTGVIEIIPTSATSQESING